MNEEWRQLIPPTITLVITGVISLVFGIWYLP